MVHGVAQHGSQTSSLMSMNDDDYLVDAYGDCEDESSETGSCVTSGMKHVSELFEEWLNWPGDPFEWQECDSPIENDLFHELHKFASDQVALTTQQEFQTARGLFRVDFLLQHRTTGRSIVIECDGRQFHQVEQDCLRDKAIINTGKVARVYRVAGKDIHYHSTDVLHLIALLEPWIVSDGFHEISSRLGYFEKLRQDDEVDIDRHGYHAIVRTYFEYAEEGNDDEADEDRAVIQCRKITPTFVRHISGVGHASAFEIPPNPKPLPMPIWKSQLAEWYRQESLHKVSGGQASPGK